MREQARRGRRTKGQVGKMAADRRGQVHWAGWNKMERQEVRRGQVGKIAKVRRGKVENRAGDSWQEGRGQEGTSGMEGR
jgi:hypothetical protein